VTNAIDNAIARLQDLSQACTTVTIKSAPDYPVENAEPAPFSIAHLASGEVIAQSSGWVRILPIVNVDFYFSLTSLKQAYQQLDLIAVEYARRLAGDPTLNGTIDTIVFEGLTFEDIGGLQWGSVPFHVLRFSIPLKINTTNI
jgi:hypothetical protein